MLELILSAVFIFCLLLFAVGLALIVPIEKKDEKTEYTQTCETKEIQPSTLLETLAKYSYNVPAIVQFIEQYKRRISLDFDILL